MLSGLGLQRTTQPCKVFTIIDNCDNLLRSENSNIVKIMFGAHWVVCVRM